VAIPKMPLNFTQNCLCFLGYNSDGPPTNFLVYLNRNHSGDHKYQNFEINVGGDVMIFGTKYRPMAQIVTAPQKVRNRIRSYRHMVFVNRNDEWIYIDDANQTQVPIDPNEEPNLPSYVLYALSSDNDKS
jgi:hypothetical protein